MSDDRTVRLWDVSGSGVTDDEPLTVLRGHTDYVRAGAAALRSNDEIFSGGYDQRVCVWDTRAPGRPVQVICFCYVKGWRVQNKIL